MMTLFFPPLNKRNCVISSASTLRNHC